MRTTKNWGFTNSGAELYMLDHAEQHRKELERERKAIQRRLLKVNETNKRRIN